MFHRLQAVGDHDDRLLFCQRLDRPHQIIFVLRIHIGGGFVEENDRRVLHHCPRNGNALLFSAGEAGAAFSDHCFVPIRQYLDKVVAAGLLRRLDHFLHRRIRLSETDIVGNSIVEKVDILENKGEVLHQGIHVVILHISSAQGHCSGIHIPEPGQQVHKCRLASTGRSDNGRCSLLRNLHGHTVNDLAFLIGKLHILRGKIPVLGPDHLPCDIHLRCIQDLLRS